MMSPDTKAKLQKHITDDHQSLLDSVARLKSPDFNIPVYASKDPQTWRIHSVIAHLASASSGMLLSAKAVAAGKNPVPQDFELSRWNQRAVDNASEVPVTAFLDEINTSHKDWLAFLAHISPKHLRRRGRHARGDILSVAGFMRRHSKHEAQHAAEIYSAVRAHESESRKRNA